MYAQQNAPCTAPAKGATPAGSAVETVSEKPKNVFAAAARLARRYTVVQSDSNEHALGFCMAPAGRNIYVQVRIDPAFTSPDQSLTQVEVTPAADAKAAADPSREHAVASCYATAFLHFMKNDLADREIEKTPLHFTCE
jgi:hypothetical protein